MEQYCDFLEKTYDELYPDVEIIKNTFGSSTLLTLKKIISPKSLYDFQHIHLVDGPSSYMFVLEDDKIYQMVACKKTLVNEVQLNARISYLRSSGYKISCVRILEQRNIPILVVMFG